MKIHFLGTCHGCQEKNRYLTCMVLEVNDAYYLIDAGAPFRYIMMNKDMPVEKFKAGFITHMHGDHAIHAYDFAVGCGHVLYLPEPEDIKSMEDLIYFMHCEWAYERFGKCAIKCVADGKFYQDENIQVTSIPTKHLARGKSFGYMIEAEGKRVLFTGDLSGTFEDYPKITEECDFDAVICELTHFEVETAMPKFNRTRTKQMIFNHIRDDKVALLKEHEQELTVPYSLTNDGDVFEI
ncbi:MAG: ribonuclease Z [Clostridia bacterium]|nr:ribonuclease Z [Clostridia bacterium]